MAPDRALDPQQINLYAYTRNNPLRFVDPFGEIINEPTGLDEKHQKRYDDWKAKFLSTAEGQKQWAKYNDDKNFTLNITVIDRGSDSRNASAEVKDFKFDKGGTFVGATMELGNNLGSGGSQDPESYPVSSTVASESSPYDSHTKAAVKIGHEFGHLDDFRNLGHTFYEQQTILDSIEARRQSISNRAYGTDPIIQGLRSSFQKQFGESVDRNGIRRENNAERNAIPVIRQLLGSSMSKQTEKAIKVLEKQP